jgi:hypothetical protein
VDDVFDEAFRQLGSVDRVACSLLNESTLLLESDNGLRIEIPVRRAKGILRLMCARLAVRASEWARREVSPYGDSIVFDLVKAAYAVRSASRTRRMFRSSRWRGLRSKMAPIA